MSLARHLREHGEDAVHLLELGLAQASDAAVWNLALDGQRVVVTKDEDFSNLLVQNDQGQVVWVRLGNCRKRQLIAAWDSAYDAMRSALSSGQRLIILV